MLAVYYTNEGPLRNENQDCILIHDHIYSRTENPECVDFETQSIFVVADGVGGYRGGDVASLILVKSLSNFNKNEDINIEPSKKIKFLCYEASLKMKSEAQRDNSLSNMSTTMAGVIVSDTNIEVFNCGDCRVYMLIEPYLRKISHDHSVVQVLYDDGIINDEEMRKHPRKNEIISSIGVKQDETEIFFKNIAVIRPLKLFICSDGVWESLSLDTLEDILIMPSKEAALRLKEALFNKLAKDNISFIILDI